ncbi:MAG: ring-opening amidohydrolase [Ancalomicrobiaceae bacterium]|nr:ring-opening amidohydrolase [Ancalomicrobiaceae bacterium]
MPHVRIHRLPMSAPNDTSAIERAIAAGTLPPAEIVAILAKTEGNGCVNDFTRGYAVQSLKLLLSRYLPAASVDRVSMAMSGGTEGGLSPHWLVIAVDPADHPHQGPALAVGRTATRDLLPEEIGRLSQLDLVADAVTAAMAEARISTPEDVHYVQLKCPLLTAERIRAAKARGETVATTDTLKSMGLSRGASALGVAVALGELDRARLSDATIGVDRSLWSGVASASAGVELMEVEVVVMGMSAAWSGDLVIDHAVMADAIDTDPVRDLIDRLGFDSRRQIAPSERRRLIALMAKAEASSDGTLRDARHTMLDDSDVSSTRHARGFVAGALAGLVGTAEIFVSGGAEHQGPDGGGPCAIIALRNRL